MISRKYLGTVCVAVAAATLTTAGVSAKSFKAKYYPECYSDVADVAELVTPPESMSEKAGKASGLFGSVASIAGLGGMGGSVYKAAGTVNNIQKYSGLIDSASGFSAQMAEDHPDPNDRFAAYGTHMNTDAQNVQTVQQAIVKSQTCYNSAFDSLAQQVASGEVSAKKVKKQIAEIQKGAQSTGDVLILTMDHANKNLETYNSALSGEEDSSKTGLAALATSFALKKGASSLGSVGIPGTAAVYGGAMGLPTNLNTLSSLAEIAVLDAVEGGEAPSAGVQAVSVSSQKYISLYNDLTQTVEAQRQLELKVNKGL